MKLMRLAELVGLLAWGLTALPAWAQEGGPLAAADIAALQARGAAEGWTFTVTENDATLRPLSELCGLVEPPDWREGATFDPCTPLRALPAAFDWRSHGGVPPIRNQGGCGSCWAFGTVGAMECAIKIRDHYEVDLSEQWLVSCNQSGWGCAGGWWAHDYHQWRTDTCDGTGAVLEADFPYVAYDAPCNCPYPHEYFIDSWAYIGSSSGVPSTSSIKQAILDYGPVSVAVYVGGAFQGYGGGVFNSCESGTVNHAVVLVGWDDSQGCWIMRNSWGPNWGESGYMRITYGCSSIGYAACYVNYPSRDCNENGIVDACDIDCGPTNGPCDQPGCGQSSDCDGNELPDECDMGTVLTQNFSGQDGALYRLNGSATLNSGAIRLTAAQSSQTGSAVFTRRTYNPLRALTADFDFRIGGGTGAHGLSFSMFDSATHTTFETFGETGPSANAVTIEFDTYANSGENNNHLQLWLNGTSLGSYTPTFDLNNDQWHHAHILLDAGVITVTLTPSGGSSQTAFYAVNLPGYTEFAAYFGFGARTASSQTDNHWIDNVALDYATSKNCDRDGIHDDCEWVTMITSQPSSQGVCPGTTAVFQCAAAQPQFGYRWQKNGMPLNDGGNISGALTGTLNVSNAQTVDVGTYTCGVIDGCVTALSQNAALSISVAPGISGHPRELLHACAGNDASFSVSITGTPPFTCVWHRNGEVITGASTPILTLHGVSGADDESVYTCLVSNPCGSAWSNSGRLNVVPLPDFTLQPEDACGESGESVALSAAASAERAIYWQWWKDDVLVPGASGPTLPLDDLLTADAGLYSARAIITSPTFCTAWSDPAEVVVNGCPVCPAPGDLDGDGDWDLADAAEFARCLGPGGAWQPGCACANVNTDYNENVDLTDWQMLLETWTGPTP